MMYRPPPPSRHLFKGGTGVIEPALVIPDYPTRRRRYPGKLRHVVRQQAEPLFAFAKARYHLLLRRDVASDLAGSYHTSGVVGNRRNGNRDMHFAAEIGRAHV